MLPRDGTRHGGQGFEIFIIVFKTVFQHFDHNKMPFVLFLQYRAGQRDTDIPQFLILIVCSMKKGWSC